MPETFSKADFQAAIDGYHLMLESLETALARLALPKHGKFSAQL